MMAVLHCTSFYFVGVNNGKIVVVIIEEPRKNGARESEDTFPHFLVRDSR
jgi:predicted Fe-Mo cluster-binding NifX family protein